MRRPLGPYAQHVNHVARTLDTATTRSLRLTRRPRCPYDAATTRSLRPTWRPRCPHDAANTPSVRRRNHSVRTHNTATTWSAQCGDHSVRTTQRNARCIGMHDAGPTPRGMGISHLAYRDVANSLILFLMQLLLWRVRLSDKRRSDAHRNHMVDGPTNHLRVAITILKAVSIHLPPMDRLGRVRGYRLHPALAAFHLQHHRHHRYHHQNHRLPASPISTCPV